MTEYLDKMKDSLARFEEDLKGIQTAKTFDAVSDLERKAYNDGMDVTMLCNNLRRDLTEVASVRRKEIRDGSVKTTVVEKVKETVKKTTAKKPAAKKVKKA